MMPASTSILSPEQWLRRQYDYFVASMEKQGMDEGAKRASFGVEPSLVWREPPKNASPAFSKRGPKCSRPPCGQGLLNREQERTAGNRDHDYVEKHHLGGDPACHANAARPAALERNATQDDIK